MHHIWFNIPHKVFFLVWEKTMEACYMCVSDKTQFGQNQIRYVEDTCSFSLSFLALYHVSSHQGHI